MTFNNIRELSNRFDIILGSSSPRRDKLLSETGISFEKLIPEIDESQRDQEAPYDYALRLACEKALNLTHKLTEQQLVISCDTIVVLNNKVMGKPESEEDAFKILTELSGSMNIVCTSIAIADSRKLLKSGYETTKVFFNEVSPDQIKDYIETKEPMDKAGAYGIQGMGAFLVDRIEGNLDNVIGFPRTLLEDIAGQLLTDFNQEITGE